MPNVVTRFAPSPTGFLHIGGARTALYNWLFARHHGGQFLLRIEDTDLKRSTQEAIDAIIDGMKWLGLDWDGEAISQAGRASRHAEVAHQLLETGKAYKCYATSEEIAEAREKARAEGRNFLGDLWRDRDPSEAPEGAPYSVRIRMPREGETTLQDAVQGPVTVQNDNLDDMIILRSDGTPTYMLAVVVDDHDMGVTHIVRGDDHLNNAFRQHQIYTALGWTPPTLAHIPLIHGGDGKKLSKRHGALGVEAYRDMGYLPEAMRNYLLRLGWSHGDDEIIPTEQAIEWFNLENIGRGPSRFDFDKLDNLNSHYIRELNADSLLSLIRNDLENEIQHSLTKIEEERLIKGLPALAERAKRMPDITENASLFCNTRPLSLSENALKALSGDTPEMLAKVANELEAVTDWNMSVIKAAILSFAEAEDLKLGKVMQPIRAAATGGKQCGDLVETLEILGQEETIGRLRDRIAA
ncbi:MAG: glutamate--tRNA ligase [Alphaproteobacteria bacterium]|nr:glutamate--tRNA ligase [Alphaproteobacteria bacterium]